MRHRFLEIATTDAVREEQRRRGSRRHYARFESGEAMQDRLGAEEAAFIAERDGFYLASVSATGWPYVQFRGGPPGFLRVLDERTLAFADFRGNRQYITAGNLAGDARVAMILMNYAHQQRLKLYGRATIADGPAAPGVVPEGADAEAERTIVVAVEAFDWNCPRHITPRWTVAEIEAAVVPLRARVAELEREVARLSGPPATDGRAP